jgi:hypothetical protein
LTWTASRSWALRRLAISAFLLWHLSATIIWVSPQCPIQKRFGPYLRWYMLPSGLWQYWAMFAPNPIHDTVILEAEVIDNDGIRHRFEFPKMANYTWWQGIVHFRYAKYNANISSEEFVPARTYAARHVLRQLKLPAEAYPVSVHLIYQMHLTPPVPPLDPDPSQPAATPEAAPETKSAVVGTIRIESPRELNL